MKKTASLLLIIFIIPFHAFARECRLPDKWSSLCCILENRINQTCPKMKLEDRDVVAMEEFLHKIHHSFEHLAQLQSLLPYTTLELLMSMKHRDVSFHNADSMAQYLKDIVKSCKFMNIEAFDKNTSHIIGRNFNEIDYSAEPLTQHRQKAKYDSYGVTNFKNLENLKKFFPIESKLPYFQKIYRPSNCDILKK